MCLQPISDRGTEEFGDELADKGNRGEETVLKGRVWYVRVDECYHSNRESKFISEVSWEEGL